MYHTAITVRYIWSLNAARYLTSEFVVTRETVLIPMLSQLLQRHYRALYCTVKCDELHKV